MPKPPVRFGPSVYGNETVTYIYGLVVPEPSSVIVLSSGLAGVAGMAGYRRTA